MSKFNLSKMELEYIEHHSSQFGELFERFEKVRQFKEGDYLICYRVTEDYLTKKKERHLLTNSYGTPTKFVVVHSDRNGMPFIKKIDSKGKPIGSIISMLGDEEGRVEGLYGDVEWEVDPDFAEAIILDSTSDFDPAQMQRDKQTKFKEITNHNKAAKLKVEQLSDVVQFFKSLNPGDTFWQSSTRAWLVKDKKMEKPSINTPMSLRKCGNIPILTIEDQKGNIQTVSPLDFHGKAIYRMQPRSYRELKI